MSTTAMRSAIVNVISRLGRLGSPRETIRISNRTFFTASGVGMDQYARIRELTAIRMGANGGQSLKNRFLHEENQQVLTEDIKNMLYLAETDQEIESVIKAIQQHRTQNRTFNNYRFGPPLMRLLTFLGKTDRAIDVFTDKELGKFCEDSATALILCNHLMEKKRYNDVVKIFDVGYNRGFITASGMPVPSDVIMLVVEALCTLNTPESFKKLEEIMTNCSQRGCNFTLRTVGMAVLLAAKQGHPDVGLDICGYIKQASAPLVRNLKALCFADIGRLDEAIQIVKLIIQPTAQQFQDIQGQAPRRFVYPIVIKHIKAAAEKQPGYEGKLDELVKQIYEGQNLSNTDLEPFLLTPMNRVYFGQMRGDQQMQQQSQNSPQRQQPYFSQPINQDSSFQYQPRYPLQQQQHQQQQQRSPQMQNNQTFNRNPYNQPQQQNQQQQQQQSFMPPPSYYQPFQQSPTSPQQYGQQPQPNPGYYQRTGPMRPGMVPPPIRPPIRSPLSGQPPNVIRNYSNPTSNRSPPIEDDEDDLDIPPKNRSY